MRDNPIIPIILCGGSGSRLWPLSRESYPKQYLSLCSNDNKTLLQHTAERLIGLINSRNPILICNEEHRFLVAEQMKEINIKPSAIILEPFGRNTAPAIALGAIKALSIEKNPNLLILSSDHNIKDEKKFLRVIEKGIPYIDSGSFVTFGIFPTSPETGYGYIRAKKPLDHFEIKGEKISQFIEKPNLETAKSFIKDNRYLWNSGIFLFNANMILEEINKFNPQIIDSCSKSMQENLVDLDFQRIEKNHFKLCPNISIDIAVMEKTQKGTVLPLSVGWSDIGSWKSVWEASEKDNDCNYIKGNVILRDSNNCYVRSENRLIAGIGIENLVIIETNDAILILDKDKSQEVKYIVQYLKNNNIKEGIENKKILRPWGSYNSLVNENTWKVKLIEVKPKECLSLQLHKYRSEHWVVVQGIAEIEVDNKKFTLYPNQSTYIPVGSKHRLSNPGANILSIVEIQSGSYLGEDDIIRFEDKYGRLKKN